MHGGMECTDDSWVEWEDNIQCKHRRGLGGNSMLLPNGALEKWTPLSPMKLCAIYDKMKNKMLINVKVGKSILQQHMHNTKI